VSLSEIMQQLRKIQGGRAGRRGHGSVAFAVEFLALVLWLSLAALELQGHYWLLVPWKVTGTNQMRSLSAASCTALHHTTTTGLCQSAGTAQPAAQDSRLTRSQLSQTGDQIRV
jgi:hypothetical protein